MFIPFQKLIECLMKGSISKKRSDTFQLIVLFLASLLFGHIMACVWIALGTSPDGWITLLQAPESDDL